MHETYDLIVLGGGRASNLAIPAAAVKAVGEVRKFQSKS